MLIDTHCHLNAQQYQDDWEAMVEEAVEAGVEKIIVPGTDVEMSKRAVTMAEQNEHIYALVGIHPEEYSAQAMDIESGLKEIEKMLVNDRVVGVGEIGLDSHYLKGLDEKIKQSYVTAQEYLFMAQLWLAQKYNKPVCVHSRSVKARAIELINQVNQKAEIPLRGVFHCFEGSKQRLQKVLDLGFYVSFTGNITYDVGRRVVAKQVPLERLLLETDGPYMSPIPFRNQRNHPSHVTIVAKKQAKLHELALDQVSIVTTRNAVQLFGLD